MRSQFDAEYYKATNDDVAAAGQDPLKHFMANGWKEGRDPNSWFSTSGYLAANPDVAEQNINPFLHYLQFGRSEGRAVVSPEDQAKGDEQIAEDFDPLHYLNSFSEADRPANPLKHFMAIGWKEGRDPNSWFSIKGYLAANPDVAEQNINPFLHYLQFGRSEGRAVAGADAKTQTAQDTQGAALGHDATLLAQNFDADFYLQSFPEDDRPHDPLHHFVTRGWKEGRDPNDWFSTRYYMGSNPDVKAAEINPFLHYLVAGKAEKRLPKHPSHMHQPGSSAGAHSGLANSTVYEECAKATSPGPEFELLDPEIGRNRTPKVKALAYYLPQFHPTPENDEFWGAGFTEWRNVARGQPRFVGHIQPNVPRDLGFYSLDDPAIMRQQIEMAAAAGLHGFCFYYYWFDGKRVLHKPVERMLADPSLDFPFVLLWANENWTRTWDGMEKHVLLAQSYDPEKDADLVADLARHFTDPRYIRIGERPLWFIYRPSQIPDAVETIARWRRLFAKNHGLDPLIMMAQGFGNTDPREFGLDGAIEFPPHKLCADLPVINDTVDLLDAQFSGQVLAYDDMVARADAETAQDFPLIRTITPHWDNESRRPGAGMTLHGSSPAKFEAWARRSMAYARANPVHGEAFIAVNAWNEWAEGAYLEPDVHYGGAYLNALSRALHASTAVIRGDARKLVLVGHDAYPHGAQILVANLARVMTRQFGIEVVILLCDGGPMVKDYEVICETHVLDSSLLTARPLIEELVSRGFGMALTNTTVTGNIVPMLKAAGFHTTSLIHELAQLLREYDLGEPAGKIARHSDRVIFPAAPVRDSFVDFAGAVAHRAELRPQGLYKTGVLTQRRGDGGLRAEHGLPANARLVVNIGYADLRKGFDRFIEVGQALCAADDSVYFVWLGAIARDMDHWLRAEVARGPLADRFLFPGLVDDVERWLAAADVFFLSAREDPFPSVVLEALAAGLPVVGYAGTGGCDALIGKFGALVPSGDTAAAVKATADFLAKTPAQRSRAARARRTEIEQNYAFDDYCFNLATAGRDPRISVILPNYNYAACLEERLTSIFAQTQPVFEVIVLDDASTDKSVDVIEAVAREQRRDVDLVVNDTNSGSPFVQWRAGLERARGDYVWIAEADDVADPHFLECLLARMRDSDADIGFTDSWQIDQHGNRTGESYKSYVNAIEPGLFDESFTAEGAEFLSRALAVKNVILNVSGVLFRKEALLAAMKRCEAELAGYSLVGDWRLYADICAHGGRLVYEAQALNGHRRHATSVTHALKAERHMAEIEEIQAYAARETKLTPEIVAAQQVHRNECRVHLGMEPEKPAPRKRTAAAKPKPKTTKAGAAKPRKPAAKPATARTTVKTAARTAGKTATKPLAKPAKKGTKPAKKT